MAETIKKAFSSETSKILQLVINSIYVNQSVFLRELISNASDACDRIRIKAIEDHKLLKEALEIRIKIDHKSHIITITDNGIGMNAIDLENNLGTIARSGTEHFIRTLETNISKVDLIGKFGLGFYSGFMVANSMKVLSTKLYEEDQTYIWESVGDGYYTITKSDISIPRGTSVILNIKENMHEYLDKHKIKHLIKTYSDYINFPIFLELDDNTKEQINKTQAIWTKNSSDITKKEYQTFYQYLIQSPDEPWVTLHNKVEGALEYTSLLFIPTRRPFNLFAPDRPTNVKLYIKKVFIADDNLNLVPKYLRFLRGIVDTDDLSLNISREMLQYSTKLSKLSKAITKSVLNILKSKAEADRVEYVKFWDAFGEVLKEGLCEPVLEEKNQLLELCLFRSTKSGKNYISLKEYIENAVHKIKKIYYLIGDSYESLISHPQLEIFKKHDIEVLLLKDTVDAFWLTAIDDYKDYDFASVAVRKIELDDKFSPQRNTAEGYISCKKFRTLSEEITKQNLTDFIKSILGSRIGEVIISDKLVESPACLSLNEGSMNIQLEKMMIEQKQLNRKIDKVLEINLKHPIIGAIQDYIFQKQERAKKRERHVLDGPYEMRQITSIKKREVEELVEIVFAQACMTAGQWMDNQNWVAKILDNMTTKYIQKFHMKDKVKL